MSYKEINIETSSQSVLIKSALYIAKSIVDRPGLWYSQQSRWGPNSYDCSGLIYTIWQDCYKLNETLWNEEGVFQGVKDKAISQGYSLSTIGLRDTFKESGFMELDPDLMRGNNPAALQAGDVLLFSHPHENAHTAMIYGRDSSGQLYIVESGGAVSEGPSAGNKVGFSRYWGGNYWQYLFRCVKGYEDSFKELNKLRAQWYVTKIYKMLLQREPDADGLEVWTNHLFDYATGKPNKSIYWVLANILSSDECKGIQGSDTEKGKKFTNEQIVTILYKLILGRDPDPAGLDAYVTLLKENPSTITVEIEGVVREISTRSYILYTLCYSEEANLDGAIIPERYNLIMQKESDIEECIHIDMTPVLISSSSKLYYKNSNNIWQEASKIYVHNGTEWKESTGIYAKTSDDIFSNWVGG